MATPEHMHNPHLRAGMAEALEALLPPRSAPNQPTMSLLSTQSVSFIFTGINPQSQVISILELALDYVFYCLWSIFQMYCTQWRIQRGDGVDASSPPAWEN